MPKKRWVVNHGARTVQWNVRLKGPAGKYDGEIVELVLKPGRNSVDQEALGELLELVQAGKMPAVAGHLHPRTLEKLKLELEPDEKNAFIEVLEEVKGGADLPASPVRDGKGGEIVPDPTLNSYSIAEAVKLIDGTLDRQQLQAWAMAEEGKGGKKRKKVLAALKAAYDKVTVQPEDLEDGAGDEAGSEDLEDGAGDEAGDV